MENRSVDDLLNKKIEAARWSRRLRNVVLTIVPVAVAVVLASSFLHRGGDEPVSPQPTDVVTPSIDEVDEISPPVYSSPAPSATPSAEDIDEPSPSAVPTDPGVTPLSDHTTTEGKYHHEIQLVWFGDADKPSALDIALAYKKNELFSTSITAADKWRYEWNDDYTAEELSLKGNFPDNISVEYTVSGENFTVTATCTQPEQLPQTGAKMAASVCVMLAGVLMLTGGCVLRRKNKG